MREILREMLYLSLSPLRGARGSDGPGKAAVSRYAPTLAQEVTKGRKAWTLRPLALSIIIFS
jgi:hypothetical protein